VLGSLRKRTFDFCDLRLVNGHDGGGKAVFSSVCSNNRDLSTLKGVIFTIFFLTDPHTTFSMNEEFLYYSPASVASSFQSCRDGREHVIDWLIKSGPNSIADYRWRASLYLEFCLPITHQPLLTLKFCNPSQYHYDTGSFITVRQPSYNPHPSSALLYFRDELHTHRILHLQPRSLCGSLNFTMVRTAG